MKQNLWIPVMITLLIAVLCCSVALADGGVLAGSGQLNDSISWTLSDAGVLTFSGHGDMPDYGNGYPSPFDGSSQITAVVIENGIYSVGDRMFVGAANLTSVSLPKSLVTIGYAAFASTGLTEVDVPSSVTVIGDVAFYNCGSLASVTVMNFSVPIYEDTFSSCPDLVLHGWSSSPTQAYADENRIPFEPVTSGQCGSDITWSIDPVTGVLTFSGHGDMLDYGNGFSSPFDGNSLITAVVIKNGIYSVGDRMFVGAANLTSVSLPRTLDTIGYGAFASTGLTEVDVPSSVTVIGDVAFYNCGSLASATVMNFSVPIYEDTFSSCPDLVLHGWSGSSTQEYAEQHNIPFEPVTSGQCGENVFWSVNLQDGAMTVTGTGPMWDYGNGFPSPFDHNRFITSVTFGNGITAVGDRAFIYATHLTGVTLPEWLEYIGYASFFTTGLTEVYIPESVTVIGESAFYGCKSLADASVMNFSVPIEYEAFASCPSLKLHGWRWSPAEEYANENSIPFYPLDIWGRMIVLPDDLTAIDSEAFTNIDALYVYIPENVTNITGNPFAGSSVKVIYGWSGTAAEAFAETYEYIFVSLNDNPNW